MARRRRDGDDTDVVVLGAPISKASISPSQAWATPAAFREALARFPTWDAATSADISRVAVRDAGDVEGDRDDADASAAHGRIEEAVAAVNAGGATVVVVGGDNSLTRPAFLGMGRARPETAWGLLTLDAHHDCRPATAARPTARRCASSSRAACPATGSRRWASIRSATPAEHARWAREQGIHIHDVEEVRRQGIETVVLRAIGELREAGARAIYADIDLDVVDRAFAPACPASLPGGLFPADVLAAARMLGRQDDVVAVDLCEVDALADVAGITVRLMAATFTSLCSGVAVRVQWRSR